MRRLYPVRKKRVWGLPACARVDIADRSTALYLTAVAESPAQVLLFPLRFRCFHKNNLSSIGVLYLTTPREGICLSCTLCPRRRRPATRCAVGLGLGLARLRVGILGLGLRLWGVGVWGWLSLSTQYSVLERLYDHRLAQLAHLECRSSVGGAGGRGRDRVGV